MESTVSTSAAWAPCSLPLSKGTNSFFSNSCLLPWKLQNGSSAVLTNMVEVNHTAKASFSEEKNQSSVTGSGNEFAGVIFVLLQRHLCSTLSGVFQLLLERLRIMDWIIFFS